MKQRKKESKLNFEKDCLDLDDLIQFDLPDSYVPDKHDDYLKLYGEELMETRKKFNGDNNTESLMKNDDYQIFLCLLRKKKEALMEKTPYYADYHIKLEDVYRNERDEILGNEEKEKNEYVDVENFVKSFIDDLELK